MANGDYAAAITAFLESYDLAPLPVIQYDLGQAYRLHGDTAKAIEAYEKYLATGETDQADNARTALAELRAQQPATPAAVAPPPATAPPPPAPPTTTPVSAPTTAPPPSPPRATPRPVRIATVAPPEDDSLAATAPPPDDATREPHGAAFELGATAGMYSAPSGDSPSFASGLFLAVGAYPIHSAGCGCAMSVALAAALDYTTGASSGFADGFVGATIGARFSTASVRVGPGVAILAGGTGNAPTVLSTALELAVAFPLAGSLAFALEARAASVDDITVGQFTAIRIGAGLAWLH